MADVFQPWAKISDVYLNISEVTHTTFRSHIRDEPIMVVHFKNGKELVVQKEHFDKLYAIMAELHKSGLIYIAGLPKPPQE